MSMQLGYLVGSAIFAVIFHARGCAQIRARRFHPWLYWLTIIATTTVGTTLADYADRSLGIGYTGGIAAAVAAAACRWRAGTGRSDRCRSTRKLPRAEMFYWITIMFSQTLGTALGDWTADTARARLYTGGAVVFGVLLAMVAAATSGPGSRAPPCSGRHSS
jgi:uncharacterized membrane-anchored protein